MDPETYQALFAGGQRKTFLGISHQICFNSPYILVTLSGKELINQIGEQFLGLDFKRTQVPLSRLRAT